MENLKEYYFTFGVQYGKGINKKKHTRYEKADGNEKVYDFEPINGTKLR